jgi:hypothetical protein
MRKRSWKLWVITTSFLMLLVTVPRADASVIGIGVGAFGPGTTLTTFTGLADGTEVNGLNVGGIVFNYSLGSGQLVIDGGPGITNNVNPPNIVSVGAPTGTLSLLFPTFLDRFGYGFAVLSGATIPNVTTINLFSGATNVGTLSFGGAPDPDFTGGFAGIQSTIPFDRATVSFVGSVPAWALDNVRTGTTGATVPEPTTFVLLGTGIGLLGFCRRKIEARF